LSSSSSGADGHPSGSANGSERPSSPPSSHQSQAHRRADVRQDTRRPLSHRQAIAVPTVVLLHESGINHAPTSFFRQPAESSCPTYGPELYACRASFSASSLIGAATSMTVIWVAEPAWRRPRRAPTPRLCLALSSQQATVVIGAPGPALYQVFPPTVDDTQYVVAVCFEEVTAGSFSFTPGSKVWSQCRSNPT